MPYFHRAGVYLTDPELIADYSEYEKRLEFWDKHKQKIRPVILERDKVCQDCGSDENLVVDHIVSMRRGGDSKPDNLQALCWLCNSKKANSDRVYTSLRNKTKLRGHI